MIPAVSTPRRRFLRSFAEAGAGALLVPAFLSARQAPAPAPAANARRVVDVHHHFYPPSFVEAWLKTPPPGEPPLPVPVRQWTLARTLDQLDSNNVSTAMLSTSVRVAALGSSAEQSRALVREYNVQGARLMQDYPGRFGLFGILPLPDVAGSLTEIAHALDVLKADGINLFTNYGDRWLGHSQFAPVLEELNRRRAVAYVHPATANCCGNLSSYVSAAVIEYPHDTTRTVLDLLFSGTFVRYPNIRWIFSHGGGTLPAMAGRVRQLAQAEVRNLPEVAPDGIDAELKKLYFEVANAAWAPTLAALVSYIPTSHILFGTDYPFVAVGQTLQELRKATMPIDQLQAIERGNAVALFPRLRT